MKQHKVVPAASRLQSRSWLDRREVAPPPIPAKQTRKYAHPHWKSRFRPLRIFHFEELSRGMATSCIAKVVQDASRARRFAHTESNFATPTQSNAKYDDSK